MKSFNVNEFRPFVDDDGQSKILRGNSLIRTNAAATLRYQDWLDIDREVQSVAVDRLVGIGDLTSRGLTRPLGNIGITVSMFQRSSDLTGAMISMSPENESERDRMNYDTQSVPVPIVHKEFRYDIRELTASQANGGGLEMDTVAAAARVVAEKSEDMLFAGAAVQVDGSNKVYGYTTHPDRNTVDLSLVWDDNTKTGANILTDVQTMLAAARADKMHGPFMLYIPRDYETKLDNDYVTGATDRRTIRERIMQLNGIIDIRVADRLADDNVVLVQMTRETVDLAIAQDITTIQWAEKGGMVSEFKVMAVWVPRVKSDFEGRSGVVHLRPA